MIMLEFNRSITRLGSCPSLVEPSRHPIYQRKQAEDFYFELVELFPAFANNFHILYNPKEACYSVVAIGEEDTMLAIEAIMEAHCPLHYQKGN